MNMENAQPISMRANARWNMSLINIVALTAVRTKRPINMIEVGSYQGESAEIFCMTGAINSIWCIDPWCSGYDSNDEASKTDMNAA